MTESLYSVGFKNKAPFCVSFAINLSLKVKYPELKRMKTISFKQLSKGGKTKTLLDQKLPIIVVFYQSVLYWKVSVLRTKQMTAKVVTRLLLWINVRVVFFKLKKSLIYFLLQILITLKQVPVKRNLTKPYFFPKQKKSLYPYKLLHLSTAKEILSGKISEFLSRKTIFKTKNVCFEGLHNHVLGGEKSGIENVTLEKLSSFCWFINW